MSDDASSESPQRRTTGNPVLLSAIPSFGLLQTEKHGGYRIKRLVLDGFRALPRVHASTP